MPPEPDESFDFLPGGPEQHDARHSGTKVTLTPKRDDFPFLIADHAFDAHSLDAEKHERDPHAICLSFDRGELVYVHYVHASGWGDVTLVKSGERGWIPVDYFSGFSDPRAISLLAAIAAFLSQPRSQKLYVPPQPIYTFSEAAINEIIAGTRLLLTKTDVLKRDADLVKTHVDVAVARKSLLTELAHLVHVAKHNKHSPDTAIIEKLLRGCYRLLDRALALLRAVDDHPKALEVLSKHPSRVSAGSTRSAASSIASVNSAKSGLSDIEGHPLYRMNSFTDYSDPPIPEARLYEVLSAFTNYLEHFLDPNEVLLADPNSPNTPSIILALTRHCMLACRELLAVLDIVPNQEVVESCGKEELLEEIRRLVGGARSVVASLPPSPSNLRTVAAQNMAVTASKCQELAMRIGKESLKYIKENPGLELPPNRAYPVFTFEKPVDVSSLQIQPAEFEEKQIQNHELGQAQQSQTNKEESNFNNDDRQFSKNRFSPQVSPRSELSPSRVRAATRTARMGQPSGNDKENRNISTGISEDVSFNSSFNTSEHLELSEPRKPTGDEEESQRQDELIMRNGRVRGGSLTALVNWLTGEHYMDLEFEVRAFLLTFRLFSTSRDVVIELGSQEPSEGVKHMAKLWVESFWEPEDNVLNSIAPILPVDTVNARKKLINEGKRSMQITELPVQPISELDGAASEKRMFSYSSSSSVSSSVVSLPNHMRRNPSLGAQFGTQSALNLAASFREFGLGGRRASRQTSNGEESRNGRMRAGSQASLSGGEVNGFYVITSDAAEYLLSTSVSDIANQLTLMWFDIFKMLRPSELLDQRFSSSKRSLGLAPHVTQLIVSSNHLTAFVGDTILSPELNTKQRARVLKHWIRVADELFSLGNLNGTVTIMLTLQSTRIVRLSKAWESLGNKSHNIFMKLVPLASPDRNFHEYRTEFRNRHGSPCVPYMGILLGDLTFISEGNPKILKPSNAINFDRYLKMAHAIASIQPFQHIQFNRCTPDVNLQSWLRSQMAKSYSQDTRDADEQWRRSLLIQPAE